VRFIAASYRLPGDRDPHAPRVPQAGDRGRAQARHALQVFEAARRSMPGTVLEDRPRADRADARQENQAGGVGLGDIHRDRQRARVGGAPRQRGPQRAPPARRHHGEHECQQEQREGAPGAP
jgi:hypothetical protein